MAFAATSAHAQDASGGQTSGPGAQPIPPQDMPIQAGPGGTTTQARVRTSPTTTAPVYGNTGGLADIVVTARRRSESLQTVPVAVTAVTDRSEEHTSELQSLMRISYAVFCLKKKKKNNKERESNITNKVKTHT